MAGTTIIMSKLKHIVRLRSNGVPLQTIAKASGLSRNTVKKYLRLIEVKKLEHEDLLKMDDAVLDALLNDPEPQDHARHHSLVSLFSYIEKELARTGVNRWVLWGEYRLLHPDGYSYSQFCDYYRQWKKTMSGSFHQTHQPGEKMFIDYTGKKLSIVDPQSGEVTEVEVYVAVLGYSQLTYVEAVESQKKEDFIHATQNALHFFGGVPRVLIPDNLKSAVQKPINMKQRSIALSWILLIIMAPPYCLQEAGSHRIKPLLKKQSVLPTPGYLPRFATTYFIPFLH